MSAATSRLSTDMERADFIKAHPHLDVAMVPDAWGRPMFSHSHVEAIWSGWNARGIRDAAQGQRSCAETLNKIAQLTNVGRGDVLSLQDAMRDIHSIATAFLDAAPQPASNASDQDLGCLKFYIENMNEANWKDMRLHAERQLERMGRGDLAYAAWQPETTRNLVESICDDCPPVGYPTDKTRCTPCPRRTTEIPSTSLGGAAK